MSDTPNKDNQDLSEDISLESILAEYKSEAFIADEKRTPKKTLDEQAEQILQETLGKIHGLPPVDVSEVLASMPESPPAEESGILPKDPVTPAAPPVPTPAETEAPAPTVQLPQISQAESASAGVPRQKLEPDKVIEIPYRRKETPPPPEQAPTIAEEIGLDETAFIDTDPEVTEHQEYADADKIEDYLRASEDLDAALQDEEEDEEEEGGLFARLLRGKKDSAAEPGLHKEEGEYDEEDFEEDGLSLREAAGKYGKGVSKYHTRGLLIILLSLLMLLFTARGDAGLSLPGVLGTARGLTAGLMVMQLIAMVLASEIVATGILDIIRLRPGAESLVTIAALASIGDAVMILHTGLGNRGLPYAAVVAFSFGTAMLGVKTVRNAMKMTFRTAAMGRDPYVVNSKLGALKEGFSLFKSKGDTEGFIRKTQQMDFSEYLYTIAAPLLLAMSAVFALFAALGSTGEILDAVHHFAAMTAVSASFTGLLAYGIPYSLLAGKLTKVGAALAGWGGASEVSEAKGVIVTDSDVFPAGTLTLSGVKFFEKSDPEKIIAYTGSIVLASGCGLSALFEDLLQKEKLKIYQVTDLACYEGGGIGAKIDGEEVIIGSASLMKLVGIHLPQNIDVKNAVFTVIRGELAGVFAIDYKPLNSVKEALVSLLHTKIHPLFALRDFSVTPMMLQNKFQIQADKIDFLSYEERYALNDLEPDPQGKPFAVLCREGLGPLVDIVVGGKRLKSAVIRNAILSVASSVIGLALMLSFFWAGAPETASAANVFYYQAAWLFVMIVLSRTVTLD